VLDAGSKALAADLCNLPGHGHIVEYPDALIRSLSEEHAVVDLSNSTKRPEIGERVSVIPNHVCVVTNLFDEVHLARRTDIVDTLPITSRGRMD
jgi:D-serine deaminase-like pyridoxal phosphate-dependent protein